MMSVRVLTRCVELRHDSYSSHSSVFDDLRNVRLRVHVVVRVERPLVESKHKTISTCGSMDRTSPVLVGEAYLL